MRYTRHTRLTDFGDTGQTAVEYARVVVIGAGGLGSPVLLYLAAAGVGTIGIVDDDVVDLSNLQRQVIHTTPRAGQEKTLSAEQTLTELNPNVSIIRYPYRMTPQNAGQIVSSYDVVVDCSDNFTTRYLVNDACHEHQIPHVWGAVIAYYGQVSVFIHDRSPHSVTLDDIYPRTPDFHSLPSPQEKGTFGPLCGVVGSVMAGEVIKIITGVGKIMTGRIALIDIFSADMRTLPIVKHKNVEKK
ncbi:HesA/MoeB/ThiF family protein [Arcanobacterium buesumense]|uniref:HesA/MoeB/ThiF family protein n=1 Tax=Arcanobacterium buesumense TaxID=2722751 RepID=A0A6H2EM97_9ACTO|nr:HesA/MoeB/ThiF family protein [Arcanobacterium buesumense]QJC22182.1 HesA/MoeB/ThiF family protein [Arcanobacterium buesumense]